MKKLDIEKTFADYYLTCGVTYDNFIFENCPIEFVLEAEKLLSVPTHSVKPCNVKFTREDEIKIEQTLQNCVNDWQKDVLARDFVTALVMGQVLKDIPEKGMHYSVVKEQIKAYLENQFWRVKQLHATSFFPGDVADYAKKFGRIELNIFLVDTQSKAIQRAINNFICSRTPYSIKLFTTNARLPSYQDQAGNLMQAPHDYMNVDVNKYITITESQDLLF